jgi:hypothetical protein
VGSGYLVAVFFDEPVQSLNARAFLVVGSNVQNLGDGAVSPGLQSYLNSRGLLGEGIGVIRDGQAQNYGPLIFGDKVSVPFFFRSNFSV